MIWSMVIRILLLFLFLSGVGCNLFPTRKVDKAPPKNPVIFLPPDETKFAQADQYPTKDDALTPAAAREREKKGSTPALRPSAGGGGGGMGAMGGAPMMQQQR